MIRTSKRSKGQEQPLLFLVGIVLTELRGFDSGSNDVNIMKRLNFCTSQTFESETLQSVHVRKEKLKRRFPFHDGSD